MVGWHDARHRWSKPAPNKKKVSSWYFLVFYPFLGMTIPDGTNLKRGCNHQPDPIFKPTDCSLFWRNREPFKSFRSLSIFVSKRRGPGEQHSLLVRHRGASVAKGRRKGAVRKRWRRVDSAGSSVEIPREIDQKPSKDHVKQKRKPIRLWLIDSYLQGYEIMTDLKIIYIA